MQTRFVLALLGGLAACGGGGTSGDDDGMIDAPVAAQTIMVTGTASEIGISGRTPLAGVTVEAYKEGDTTPVASAMSDAQGNYTIAITTNGVALDGYLLGKKGTYKDTYLYPPRPISADLANATMLMLTPSTFDAASTLSQTPRTPGTGWIGVQVYDAANMPVGNATVTSSPAGMVRYNGSNGLPSKTPTVTAADGIAYIFNVAAGNVTISASGGSLTFHSHPLNARADQVTTTVIQP